MLSQNLTEIKSIAEEFVGLCLSNEVPNNKCFSTCLPLFLLFRSKGIKINLVQGSYNEIDHYWLCLNYDNKIIIDPTLNQFESKDELVYIGAPLKHKPDKVEPKHWFEYSFNRWAEPFYPLTYGKFTRANGFYDILIQYNLKVASILLSFFEKNNRINFISESEICRNYFYTVCQYVEYKKSKCINFNNIMNTNFKNLLNFNEFQ